MSLDEAKATKTLGRSHPGNQTFLVSCYVSVTLGGFVDHERRDL